MVPEGHTEPLKISRRLADFYSREIGLSGWTELGVYEEIQMTCQGLP